MENYSGQKKQNRNKIQILVILDQFKFSTPQTVHLTQYDLINNYPISIYQRIPDLALFDHETEITYLANKNLDAFLNNPQPKATEQTMVFTINVQIRSQLLKVNDEQYSIKIYQGSHQIGKIFSNEIIQYYLTLKTYIMERFLPDVHESEIQAVFQLQQQKEINLFDKNAIRAALIHKQIELIKVEKIQLQNLQIRQFQWPEIRIVVSYLNKSQEIIKDKRVIKTREKLKSLLKKEYKQINETHEIMISQKNEKGDQKFLILDEVQERDYVQLISQSNLLIVLINEHKSITKFEQQILDRIDSMENTLEKLLLMEKKQEAMDKKLDRIENKMDQIIALLSNNGSTRKGSAQIEIERFDSITESNKDREEAKISLKNIPVYENEQANPEIPRLQPVISVGHLSPAKKLSEQPQAMKKVYQSTPNQEVGQNGSPMMRKSSFTDSKSSSSKVEKIEFERVKSNYTNNIKYKINVSNKAVVSYDDHLKEKVISIYIDNIGQDSIPLCFGLLNKEIESINEVELKKKEKKVEISFKYSEFIDRIGDTFETLKIEIFTCDQKMLIDKQYSLASLVVTHTPNQNKLQDI